MALVPISASAGTSVTAGCALDSAAISAISAAVASGTSAGIASIPAAPSAASSFAASVIAALGPSWRRSVITRAPNDRAFAANAASRVTTMVPASVDTLESAVSTSSIMAIASPWRSSFVSTPASRCLASARSLAGTTAHIPLPDTRHLRAAIDARAEIQHRPREPLPIRQGPHQRAGRHSRQGQGLRLRSISLVYHDPVEKVVIVAGNRGLRQRHAELRHDLGGRSLHGLAADQRR